MANSNPCTATKSYKPGMEWQCRKRADHVLHPGKYARQHMDSKNSPSQYWDSTDEEIANYEARITNEETGSIHSGGSREA